MKVLRDLKTFCGSTVGSKIVCPEIKIKVKITEKKVKLPLRSIQTRFTVKPLHIPHQLSTG